MSHTKIITKQLTNFLSNNKPNYFSHISYKQISTSTSLLNSLTYFNSTKAFNSTLIKTQNSSTKFESTSQTQDSNHISKPQRKSFDTNTPSSSSYNSNIISSKSLTKSSYYDIVIVGYGLVGASFAAAIASSEIGKNLKVLVVDKDSPNIYQSQSSVNIADSNSKNLISKELLNFVEKRKENPSFRVSALTLKSKQFLEDIGVQTKLSNNNTHNKGLNAATTYQKMEVQDQFSSGRLSQDIEDIKTRNTLLSTLNVDENIQKSLFAHESCTGLGQIVENDILLQLMREHLYFRKVEENLNFEVLAPIEIENIGYNDDLSNVSKEEFDYNNLISIDFNSVDSNTKPKKVFTKLIVGADGFSSKVKSAFKIPAIGQSYDQKAVVATVEIKPSRTSKIKNKTAYQRFLPDGPLAFLPLYDNFGSLVWTTTPEHADRLINCSTNDFINDVNFAFRAEPKDFSHNGRTPQFSQPLPDSYANLLPILFPESQNLCPPNAIKLVDNKRASFPLKLVHTQQYIGHRFALIGDSAHVIHPMAGQGLNMGLYDVQQLVQCLSEAMNIGVDIGDYSILERYQGLRQPQNLSYLFGVDFVKRIFGSSNEPFSFARNVGLDVINSVPYIKDNLARIALGGF